MLTPEQKQKIIDFYQPKMEGRSGFSIVKDGKKYYFNGFNMIKMAFGFGKTFSSLEEAEKDSGTIIITPFEFFQEIFPEDFEKAFDKRTYNYLQSCKKNLGLIDIKYGYDGEIFENQFSYRIWADLTGSGAVEVGQLEDGTWVAEFSYRCGIDDYVIVDMYFEKKPSKKDIMTAKLIEDILDYLFRPRWEPFFMTFNCWECGSETHWLDIPGSLEEKWEYYKEKFCNRC